MFVLAGFLLVSTPMPGNQVLLTKPGIVLLVEENRHRRGSRRRNHYGRRN